jgi:hypothetical protein
MQPRRLPPFTDGCHFSRRTNHPFGIMSESCGQLTKSTGVNSVGTVFPRGSVEHGSIRRAGLRFYPGPYTSRRSSTELSGTLHRSWYTTCVCMARSNLGAGTHLVHRKSSAAIGEWPGVGGRWFPAGSSGCAILPSLRASSPSQQARGVPEDQQWRTTQPLRRALYRVAPPRRFRRQIERCRRGSPAEGAATGPRGRSSSLLRFPEKVNERFAASCRRCPRPNQDYAACVERYTCNPQQNRIHSLSRYWKALFR